MKPASASYFSGKSTLTIGDETGFSSSISLSCPGSDTLSETLRSIVTDLVIAHIPF